MQREARPLVLADMTERGAAAAPDRTALVLGDRRLSYGALHDLVLRAVAALRLLGIGPDDRVGYLGLNSIDYAVLMQAALRIGAVTVNINWRLVAREVAYIAEDAELALLVTEAERLPQITPGTVGRVLLVDAKHDGLPPFEAWIRGFAPDPDCHACEAHHGAIQLYTSGTTGAPKGAILTHGSLSAAMHQSRLLGEDWAAWVEEDVSLIAMPQFHIGGTGWTVNTLNAGATGILLGKPEIEDIIDAIERQRVTKMFAVPAVLAMILNHPRARGADLSSLTTLLYGASPIPLDILKRSMALFPNARFVQMYGATETSGTIVYLPPEDHHVDGTPRMAGCGKPFPEVELRIADAAGNPLPRGQIGEVLVRSPLVMGGYHRLPDATAGAFVEGGWYRTGDAGYLDADGYLYLYDRVKDMIVSGGENIYPVEIENALHEHPGVRDCAVIGVPDPKWGEAVKAVVVPEPGREPQADELIAFARKRIAGYKVPKSIDFVDALPRNPSGKILKKELRRPYWPEGERRIG
ncbi:long-chain-fatty-acid--CoA ligase [Sphingomonas sp.]|jgi:long-chain acyl-CoA synthetase|uniref:long-chain-fatty-acid--CoA ligase n=1 Tax=Sphingomonas sp. TaxID=28214 RepID=UPI002DF4750F|nr:long-chain-fatty-acid--CoA ligase [Sphingomonas sp.]